MAHPLIGLIGKKRAGKDSVAARLVSAHVYTRFAFADNLKAAALAADPTVVIEGSEYGLLADYSLTLPYGAGRAWTPPLSHLVGIVGWEKAKEFRAVRSLLQRFGVGIRAIDPDFWVRTAFAAVDAHDGPAVITDVRFPNEVEAVQQRGGSIVRVLRPGLESTDQHISETALDDVAEDYTIHNDQNLEDLDFEADLLADWAAQGILHN